MINIARAILFYMLVVANIVCVLSLATPIGILLLCMLLVWVLPGQTRLQQYCKFVWIWVDQGFQVMWSPLLNFILRPCRHYMFGNPDETASSVIGKNLTTNMSFVYIDKVLSFFDKTSKTHAKDSIERDEHIEWRG